MELLDRKGTPPTPANGDTKPDKGLLFEVVPKQIDMRELIYASLSY